MFRALLIFILLVAVCFFDTSIAQDGLQSDLGNVDVNSESLNGWIVGVAVLCIGIAVVSGFFGYFLLKNQKVRRKEIQYLKEQNLKFTIEKKNLVKEIEEKSIQLENFSFEISAQKNLLRRIKRNLEVSNSKSFDLPKTEAIKMAKMIRKNAEEDDQWLRFQMQFSSALPGFFNTLSKEYPGLTRHEIRLCTYFKMDLTNKEVALLLNISPQSLIKARYRLKKKMRLPKNKNIDEAIKEMNTQVD